MKLQFKIQLIIILIAHINNVYSLPKLDPNLKITNALFNQYKQIKKRLIAVAVVINQDNKILIAQHGNNGPDFFKLKWALIGGKLQAGESLLECAIRELQEETCLQASTGKLINVKQINHTAKNEIIELYFFKITNFTGEVVLNHENIGFAWVSLEELDNYDLVKNNQEVIREMAIYN